VEKIGIYSGSFDPVTNGHLWVIDEGRRLFDHLYVLISPHGGKKHLFNKEKRLEMLKGCVDHPNVTCLAYDLFLTLDEMTVKNSFTFEKKTYNLEETELFQLRGMRTKDDFDYEVEPCRVLQVCDLNTVFVVPPKHLSFLSSTRVRDNPDNYKEFVPDNVYKSLVYSRDFGLCKSGHTFQMDDTTIDDLDYTTPKSHYNKLVENGLIKLPDEITGEQARGMLELNDLYELVYSDKFFLKNVPIDSVVEPTGDRHLSQSRSFGPILIDKNEGQNDLPPAIVIEGKHRWLDAKDRGDQTILAWVGEKAIPFLDLLYLR